MVDALWAYPQLAGVQKRGCGALGAVCYGDDAAGRARARRAADAGAIKAVVVALRAHLQVRLFTLVFTVVRVRKLLLVSAGGFVRTSVGFVRGRITQTYAL